MTNPMTWPEPEPTLCEACGEPITVDRPGLHAHIRNLEDSAFPYNGSAYTVAVHDDLEDTEGWHEDYHSCLDTWCKEQPHYLEVVTTEPFRIV